MNRCPNVLLQAFLLLSVYFDCLDSFRFARSAAGRLERGTYLVYAESSATVEHTTTRPQ
jgi:hypothetical protein